MSSDEEELFASPTAAAPPPEESLFAATAAARPAVPQRRPPARPTAARAPARAPPPRPDMPTPEPEPEPEQLAPTTSAAEVAQAQLEALVRQLGLEEYLPSLVSVKLSTRLCAKADADDWVDFGVPLIDGMRLRRAARELEGLDPEPEPEPEPAEDLMPLPEVGELVLVPAAGEDEVLLCATFDAPGRLGIRFRAKRDDTREELAWVQEVLPGGLAAGTGTIVPGLVLVSINGEAARDLTFAEQTSAERLSVRPLELGFGMATGELRDPRQAEQKRREVAAADLISAACQAAADQPSNNAAVSQWKLAVDEAEADLLSGVELTEPTAEALLDKAKALMYQLKGTLVLNTTVRAAIFLYEPTVEGGDEPIEFTELQARVAAAQAAAEWLQERAGANPYGDEEQEEQEEQQEDAAVVGSGQFVSSASGLLAAKGTVLSDEQEKTVRNVVAAWVEAMVLEMEGGKGGSRGGALLWRCCGTTARAWLPSTEDLERNLGGLRHRAQADAPFEVRKKLIAADSWQTAVDELDRMDGGGLLGPAAAAAAEAGTALVDPPLPPAEMLSAVLAAIAAIYAAPTSAASKLDAIGADDLMPVLSYVLAQCSVGGALGICAEWIQKLADPPLLMDGQPAYYFTTFCGALNYLARYKDAARVDGPTDGSETGMDLGDRSQAADGMGLPGAGTSRSVSRRGVIECGLLLAQFANTSTPTPRRRPGGSGASSADTPRTPATAADQLSLTDASGGGSPGFKEIFGRTASSPLEFEAPTAEDMSVDGKWSDGKLLLGRRVFVMPSVGAGEITAFNKTLGQGSSTHSLTLDDGQVVEVMLQRKMCIKPKECTCCPDKLKWLIAAERNTRKLPAAELEAEALVVTVEDLKTEATCKYVLSVDEEAGLLLASETADDALDLNGLYERESFMAAEADGGGLFGQGVASPFLVLATVRLNASGTDEGGRASLSAFLKVKIVFGTRKAERDQLLEWLLTRAPLGLEEGTPPERTPSPKARAPLGLEEGIPPEPSVPRLKPDHGLPLLMDGADCRNTLGVCTIVKRRLAGVPLRDGPAQICAEVGRLRPTAEVNIVRIGTDGKPWRTGSHWIAAKLVGGTPMVQTVDGWLTLLPDTLVAKTEPLTLVSTQVVQKRQK